MTSMYRFKKDVHGSQLTTAKIQESLRIAAVSLEALTDANNVGKSYISSNK